MKTCDICNNPGAMFNTDIRMTICDDCIAEINNEACYANWYFEEALTRMN